MKIVDLMVETLCSTKDTINVAGDDYPAQLVKEATKDKLSAY